MWRSEKYKAWIREQPPATRKWIRFENPNIVAAHQRLPNSCGTGIKPPDTFVLPLTEGQHLMEHGGDKTFWDGIDRARLCVEHVCRYLDERHNIDGWRLALDLLTEHFDKEGIK
jgi:hypothetical protein